MGMMKCPTCSKDISDQAAACPGCGHQLKAQNTVGGIRLSDPIHLLGVLAVIAIAIGVIWYISNAV